MTSNDKPGYKVVYTVVTRGNRTQWVRLGLAFVNRDGSLTVKLDALPMNGELQIRDPRPGPDPTNS